MSMSESPSEVHSLHFDLSGVPAASDLTFHLAMRDYPLVAHDHASREEARETNRFLRVLPPDAITHRAEVAAPSDAVALGYTTRKVMVDGFETSQVMSMSIVMPHATRLRDVHRGLLRASEGLHPKLSYRRLGGNLLHSELHDFESAPDQLAAVNDAYETAVALLFKHPELINLNAHAQQGGPMTVIERCVRKALTEYDLLPAMIQAHPNDWSKAVRVKDEHDQPAFDDEGKPLFTMELHPDVAAMIANPLSRALVYAKQEEGLKGQLWSVQYGRTTAAYSGEVKPKPKTLQAEPLRAATDVRWKVKNLTPNSGLVLEDAVPFTPATGKNWRAEGYWSSGDDKSAEPFTPEMQKALADGKLWISFDELAGRLTPDAAEARKYNVAMVNPAQTRRGSGTCHLNSDGTELQFNVTSNDGPFDVASFAVEAQGGARQRVHAFPVRDGGSNGTMTVNAKNHWLRHLSAYVEFLDPAGNAKTPADWSSRLPAGIRDLYDDDPSKRFVDYVWPVEAMMGIPLPADTTHLTFPVPADASTVRISWGGLGTGRRDPVACGIGEILTVTMEMALPVVLLAAGAAATKAGGVMKILKERPALAALIGALGVAKVGLADDPGKAALGIGKMLLPAIAKAGLGKLTEAIAELIAVGAAKRAVPFINIAFFIADVAATAAALGQTSVAIRDSPRVYTTEITRSIDLKVTITSSRIWKKFPDHHHHLRVVVVYDSGATLPALTEELPNTTISDDIVVQFREVPAAGNLRVMVFFYAENGWQSGQGASAWMKAEGSSAASPLLVVPPIEIDVNEVPLGKWSVYEHMEKIDYQNGKHVWVAAPAPTATKFTKPATGGVIEKLLGITVAQFPQMAGYAWQATDLHVPPDDPTKPGANSLSAVQNLSLLQSPEKGYAAPAVGFVNPSAIAYDIVSPDDGTGRNFFVDSSRGVYDETGDPAGGFHLRRTRLDFKGAVPEYRIRTNESWGRFRHAVDSMVVHPHGYVFAIRRGTHRIYRLELPAKAVPDAESQFAVLLSSEGTRAGLIKGPIAVTLALDGRVLVLESANDRVQCFDINANPVEYFTDPATGQRTSLLSIRREPKLTLLDMAVEAKGHIFILGYSGDGRKPADYRIDLYDPAGVFLTSTNNFTAARITVDLLRNLFALNYEVLRGRDGRTEPSISHWRPPAPPQ